MHWFTDHSAQIAHARLREGPHQPLRVLREGEVMGAYMDFDRTADRAWTNAEYLVRFGLYISERTVQMQSDPLKLPGAPR